MFYILYVNSLGVITDGWFHINQVALANPKDFFLII